jgi:hypothetical protein
VDLMGRRLLIEPPAPPEFGMTVRRAGWNLIAPVDQRPAKWSAPRAGVGVGGRRRRDRP